MSRSLTDVGPVALVPAAWTVTLAVHLDVVPRRTLLIALCVMDVLLVGFAVVSRAEMTGPVLGLWQRVLLVGLVATLAGTADVALDAASDPLAPWTVLVWMVVPALAYLRTGRLVDASGYRRVYLASGALALLGALAFGVGVADILGTGSGTAVVAGLVAVALGQTAGIAAAAVQNG